MLTQKTRYSMLALLHLARAYNDGPVQIAAIATEEKIPKRFLENILLELKKSGYLDSRMGKNGGYFLVKRPDEINLLEIIRMFEGAIAFLPCVSEKYYQPCIHCRDEASCTIRHTFKDIREYTYNKLAATTLQSLL